MHSKPKNRQILQRVCVAHARLNFYFQKITETLNMNISCWNLQIQFLPFTSKNHHQTKIGAQFFFNFNKNRRNCFWPGQRKTFFFSFSSFLAFKQTKEQILFLTQPLKILNIKKCLANFTVGLLWGPAPSEKATFKSEILDFGSLVKHESCPIFFLSQKSLHPTTLGWARVLLLLLFRCVTMWRIDGQLIHIISQLVSFFPNPIYQLWYLAQLSWNYMGKFSFFPVVSASELIWPSDNVN